MCFIMCNLFIKQNVSILAVHLLHGIKAPINNILQKSSGYFIIYNSSKKQRLATVATHLRSRCLGNITAQKMSDTLNSYVGKKHSSPCAFNVNEALTLKTMIVNTNSFSRLWATYTWCPKNKQLTEFLRNGFNLLSLLPADLNESILALIDLLWF